MTNQLCLIALLTKYNLVAQISLITNVLFLILRTLGAFFRYLKSVFWVKYCSWIWSVFYLTPETHSYVGQLQVRNVAKMFFEGHRPQNVKCLPKWWFLYDHLGYGWFLFYVMWGKYLLSFLAPTKSSSSLAENVRDAENDLICKILQVLTYFCHERYEKIWTDSPCRNID